jgi:hypothetical protein
MSALFRRLPDLQEGPREPVLYGRRVIPMMLAILRSLKPAAL